MPTVEISLAALPAHVRTARLIAAAVARRAGVEDPALDEVRLAVGEACSRSVGLHQRHAPDEPVLVSLTDDHGRLTVVVSDRVPADREGAADPPDLGRLDPDALAEPSGDDPRTTTGPAGVLPSGFGLAVIAGLVDDVEVEGTPTGTVVRMTWPATGPGATGQESGREKITNAAPDLG